MSKEDNKLKKKALESLMKLPGMVTMADRDAMYEYVVRSQSHSLNFAIGGKGWGVPAGFTLLLYGPPGGGKSLIARSFAAQLHCDDPDAHVFVFDTEGRDALQFPRDCMERWGADPERYHCIQTKSAEQIFDTIKKELSAAIEMGIKIKLITIDSLTMIDGIRTSTDESMTTQQRGDHAMTIQKGLAWIQDTIRKNKIALILTTQLRAEQDQAELMRHKTVRPQLAWAGKHFAELQMLVQPNQAADGKTDFMGNALVDDSVKDLKDKGEVTGNRIRCTMEHASFGPKKRNGEFTIDYHQGIINKHEEIFRIGTGWGVIKRPNNVTYTFGDKKWKGKEAALEALRGNEEMQEAVLLELRKMDAAGRIQRATEPTDEAEASEEEAE